MSTLTKLEISALRNLVKIVQSNQTKSDKTYGKLEEVSRKYLAEIKAIGENIESTKKSIEMFSGKTYDEVIALLGDTEEIIKVEPIVSSEEASNIDLSTIEETTPEVQAEVAPTLILNEEQQAFENATPEPTTTQEEQEVNLF